MRISELPSEDAVALEQQKAAPMDSRAGALPVSRLKKGKLAGKPGSVVDSHSSRPWIAPGLKPPTRKLGGSRHRLPIWCCSEWRLPRFTLGACAPRLVSVALFLALRRTGVTRHPTLWSPDFPLRASRHAAAVWPASRYCSIGTFESGRGRIQ